MNNQPAKTPHSQANIVLDRYIKLLWAKKYWIVLIAIIVSGLWVVIFPRILQSRQTYTATAMIRFDDSRLTKGATGVEESYNQMDPLVKVGILKTRSFLEKVVDSLKLNIKVYLPKNDRLATIDSIKIFSYKGYGSYELRKNNNEWQLLYTNKKDGFEEYPVQNYKLDFQKNKLELTNFSIKFKPLVLKKNEVIKIGFVPKRSAVEGLKSPKNVDVKLRGGRYQPMLELKVISKDRNFAPVLTNTIAGLFLEQLLDLKREKTKAVLVSLGEQLKSSLREVEASEQEVKRFRERNPYVSRNQNVTRFTDEISATQGELASKAQNIQQLAQLLKEKDQVSPESRNTIFLEIVSFLNLQHTPGATVLNDQYGNTLEELRLMTEQHYSESHPRMQELNSSIKKQQQKIDDRASDYLTALKNQVESLRKKSKNIDAQIRRLPKKEFELAGLAREYEARSSIYSNILRRYNEAKVADASTTADAFLLENAVVPIVYTDMMKFLMMLLLGPLLGIALGGSIFIGLDFLQHKARSAEDIEHTLDLPVLASIPIIKNNKDLPDDIAIERKLDPKLVTIDYSPNYEAEVFRNLRTKLKLKYSEADRGKFIVTSLIPGDGKSLLASNLAVTFSQLKKPTLLIDADIRRGVQHNIFLADKKPGLSDILAHVKDYSEETISPFIQKSIIPNLFLLTSGKPVPNPTEILVGEHIERLIAVLEKRFNYILIDTPPIEMIADAFILNKIIHKMMITVRYGQTDLNRIKKKLQEFPEIKEDTIGLVFNGTKDRGKQNYYSYSYYKY